MYMGYMGNELRYVLLATTLADGDVDPSKDFRNDTNPVASEVLESNSSSDNISDTGGRCIYS